MKRRVVSAVLVVAVCAGVALAVMCLPADTLTILVGRAALLSAGLQQPSQTVELISEWVSAPTAQAPLGALNTQTVLGEVLVQAVPATPQGSTVPVKQAGAGVVLTQTLSAGKEFVGGVAIKNNSKKPVDLAAVLAKKPKLGFSAASAEVQVLITHTHTTECYLGYDAGFYNPDDKSRTDDATKNVVAVGERVAQQLRQAGIGVIHDTAIHDQPYNEAYSHSRKAVEAYLKKYSTIRVVLDIHRDAMYQSNGTRVKPTAVIDGKKAAQLMLIVGMKNTKTVPNPHTAENLAFGAHLQQALHTEYAGLMRPLLLADARYNQQLTSGMVLVEVGTDVNTLEEACYSAELLGKSLAKLLKECAE